MNASKKCIIRIWQSRYLGQGRKSACHRTEIIFNAEEAEKSFFLRQKFECERDAQQRIRKSDCSCSSAQSNLRRRIEKPVFVVRESRIKNCVRKWRLIRLILEQFAAATRRD